jgi:hypothetical protein
MAALQDLTHHQRQATRPGIRLFALCLFVVLTLAACGSDSDETSAEAGTDDAAESSVDDGAEESNSDVADSESGPEADSTESESDSTEPTTAEETAPAEGTTTTVDSSSNSSEAPDTTTAEDPSSTIDKSSVFTNPDETKPSVAPPTTVSPNSGDDLVSQVIGMTESAAIDLIRSTGRAVRVERRDGEEFMLTQDYEPDRLNLTIVSNSVTGVRLG